MEEKQMPELKNIQEWRENYFNKLSLCRKEIITDFAMSRAYNDRTFKEYMENLIKKHGKECVSLLLSYTIRAAEWDARYSKDVKEWAKSYPEIEQPPILTTEKMTFHMLHLSEHPCILNQAAKITIDMDKCIIPLKKEHVR
jgi:AraC-like DNA-binding protein